MIPYDKTEQDSILAYAKGLIGKTFKEVLDESRYLDYAITDSKIDYSKPNQKGKLGNLLEEKYFGYKANSDQQADFEEAGIELKVTCYDVLKNGKLSAGERLVLTMISFEQPVEKDFFKSHVWNKCARILLIYYERNKQLAYNTMYKIRFVNLISPTPDDLLIIQQDYYKIIYKIESGLAHELSESDTMYLGACTKGQTAEASTRQQFYFPYMPARKRAFCFKRQYMDYILNSYVVTNKTYYEPLIKDSRELVSKSFEDIITGRIMRYAGWSDYELCKIYNRDYNNNKAQWSDLTYRMLGVLGNHAAEFQKANIVVKVIRLEEDNTMNECISLPAFKFMDLVQQEWEYSDLFDYFNETRFFFVIYKRDGDVYRVRNCQFWNMPYNDLNVTVRNEWQKIKDKILSGVTFYKIQTQSSVIVRNNLPGIRDNEIIHVRPHATMSAYRLNDGFTKGNVDRDANVLPDGQYMTTQSFWINNSYILTQIIL